MSDRHCCCFLLLVLYEDYRGVVKRYKVEYTFNNVIRFLTFLTWSAVVRVRWWFVRAPKCISECRFILLSLERPHFFICYLTIYDHLFLLSQLPVPTSHKALVPMRAPYRTCLLKLPPVVSAGFEPMSSDREPYH